MTDFVAFARGMAMFGSRRVPKRVQEQLLREHLPGDIMLVGAFQKSGNYAISSEKGPMDVGDAIRRALSHHAALRDVTDIAVVQARIVDAALADLLAELQQKYGH